MGTQYLTRPQRSRISVTQYLTRPQRPIHLLHPKRTKLYLEMKNTIIPWTYEYEEYEGADARHAVVQTQSVWKNNITCQMRVRFVIQSNVVDEIKEYIIPDEEFDNECNNLHGDT